MEIIVISVVVLALIFLVASIWESVHLGLLALAGAYLVGSYAGLSTSDIAAGVPGQLLILVIGVTYLFGIARSNGALDWVVAVLMQLVRGRLVFAPWAMAFIAMAISGLGAAPAATFAIVVPIAVRVAYQYKINIFLMCLMITQGSIAGSFSPLSTWALLIRDIMTSAGINYSVGLFWLAHIAVNALIGVVAFVAFGGLRLRGAVTIPASDREPVAVGKTAALTAGGDFAPPPPSGDGGSWDTDREVGARAQLSRYGAATLAALAGLLAGTVAFGVDVGFLAIILGLTLNIIFARNDRTLVGRISWPVVLLLAGILTYINVLSEVGALEWFADVLGRGAGGDLAVLLLGWTNAVLSAFASSAGVLGASMPVLAEILQANPGTHVLGSIVTTSAVSVLVDASPLSVAGALMLAEAKAEDRAYLFKRLILWTVGMTLLAAPVLWIIFVLL